MWTGIPVFKLTEAESARLTRMEDELHKRVIGQEEAIVAVSRSIRRARAGIKDPKRPTGSFIFLGPVWRRGRRSWRARSPSSCSATRTR
jgi:ATP-dependent Clp protease ATP-binding subunit ClpC